MRASLFFLALLLAALFQADVGSAREWRVERVSGTAWTIESAEKRNPLAVGMMVPEGLTIATAKSGRIRLSSDNNVMTPGPGSVAVVRPKGRFSSKTEVLQRVGSIAFDIEERSSPHSTVQTPFMAAVVKGTAFTISVSKTDTKSDVDRRLVQVSDLRTGETAGIGAGQQASVSARATGLGTAGINAPDVAPGKPSAPSVAPLGQSLSTARETHAAEASRSSAASAGGFAAAASSHSPGVSDFGGFGGAGSDGRDRVGIGSSLSETNATASGTQDRTGERTAEGEGLGEPRNGALANHDTAGNVGPGGNNGNGNGNGRPSGSDGGGNGNGNVGDVVGQVADTIGSIANGLGDIGGSIGGIGSGGPGGNGGF